MSEPFEGILNSAPIIEIDDLLEIADLVHQIKKAAKSYALFSEDPLSLREADESEKTPDAMSEYELERVMSLITRVEQTQSRFEQRIIERRKHPRQIAQTGLMFEDRDKSQIAIDTIREEIKEAEDFLKKAHEEHMRLIKANEKFERTISLFNSLAHDENKVT
jgi:hypothetical protein